MSISDYFKEARTLAFNELEKMDASALANSDTQETIRYFQEKYFLPALEKDDNRDEQIERNILANGIKIDLFYPLKPDVNIRHAAMREPSRTRLGISITYLPQNNVFATSVTIPNGADDGDERIMSSRQNIIDHIKSINEDVRPGNLQFEQAISQRYLALKKIRIKQLADVNSWINKLPVKLVELPSGAGPTPLKLPVNQKILAVTSSAKPQEPALDRNDVNTVVEMIINTGRLFERAPEAFSTLGEEHLRDVLLAGLNMYFKGAATGETFSKVGKSDIHLTIKTKDVLIAECKKWSGEAGYKETIDQLFRYTIWRDSFGIMITFSDKKGFTEILKKAQAEAQRHQTFVVGSFKEIDTGHFVTRHIKAEDEARQIEVHHILFNLYTP